MTAKHTSPRRAYVEMLESRRLLSAAPVSLMAAMSPAPAAVHTHPTAPNIVGTFNGTYAASNGQTGQVIITIASEGKTGKIGGTLTIIGTGSLGISGTISVKGKFSLHGSAHHFAITITGSVSSDTNTLSGKFGTTAKHGSSHGTFSVSRTVI
jgi:hypothetical protein